MNIEIRDAALEARIQKQLRAAGSGSVEEVLLFIAPQAALDLVEIWRHIKEQTSPTIADCVESVIRNAQSPVVIDCALP